MRLIFLIIDGVKTNPLQINNTMKACYTVIIKTCTYDHHSGFIKKKTWINFYLVIGRIRLSVSTVNRTYELSGITHVTPFRKYGKHSTGPSTYGPWSRTYSKLFSCKPVLTVCSYGAQSNEICTYGRVSRGTIPRVRRYGLLYLRTVEYDHYNGFI